MKRDLIVAAAFMLAVPFAVLPCGAASCTLLTDAEGGTGAWTDQTRWKDGAMPQAGDDINIRASVTVTDAEMPVLMRAKYAVARGEATVLTLDLDADYEVATALAGDGAVVRKGSGTLVFRSPESSMAGGFAFEAGTVVLPPDASRMCRIVVRGGRVEMAADFTDAASRPLPPLEIASPGVVCLPRSGNLTVRGISGDGTFVVHPEADTTKAQQLVLVGAADGRAFTFSGTVPENLAFTLDGGNQRLLKPSGESRRDFRLQRGIMGVASFGEGSEAGSFGTSRVWMQGHGDATLLYLGAPGETTARRFTFTSDPQGAFTLDGGAQGGVTFTGPFTCDGVDPDFMMRLVLSGSNTVPCSLQGTFSEPSGAAVHITKRGSGCWRFLARAAAFKGAISVESGTLEYESLAEAGTACSLGDATVLHAPYSGTRDDAKAVPYAYLLGDGGTEPAPSLAVFSYVGDTDARALTRPIAIRGAARLRNASSAGGRLTLCGVTALEPGVNHLYLDGDGTNSRLLDVTNGVGTVSVVKEGTGTWELDGNLETDGGVTVRAGVLKMNFSPALSWFRFTPLKLYSEAEQTAVLGHLALFDAEHRDVARGIAYNAVANERAFDALEPGQVALDAAGDAFVKRFPPGNLFTEYVDNTTARWPLGTALVFRLPSEATVCGYDLVSGWYEDTKEEPFKWTVTDWTLEGSPDGRAWRTLDAKSDYLTCRTGQNYWLSDARPYDVASTGFPIASEDGICVKGRTLGTVAVATGATLEVRGEPAATGLSVGVDWAGTFRGVDFAPTGTLTVEVPIDAGRAFTIPCSFEDCAGTENLKNWTLSFDGDPGSTWALARADASGLLFAKQGFILIVK